MPDIKETRRRLSVVLILLLCLDLAAIIVLISPIGRGARSGQQELDRLWGELRTKDREVVPLRGIDQKVVDAKEQIANFYDTRLPASYSSVSEELGKVAAANHVQLSTGRYDSEPAEIPGIERLKIDFTLSGDYTQVVKFINALERDKMFFLINGVSLGGSEGGTVRLGIRMETYMKNAGNVPASSNNRGTGL